MSRRVGFLAVALGLGVACEGGSEGEPAPASSASPCRAGASTSLTLRLEGGEGAVTLPFHTACSSWGGLCTWDVPVCTPLRLEATPRSGFTRARWSGCDWPDELTCRVTARGPRTVRVTFEP